MDGRIQNGAKGDAKVSSRYVDEFLSLNCAPDVLGAVGPINNPSKEISEAMAVIRRLRPIVLKEGSVSLVGMLEFCAGNALTSVLACHLSRGLRQWQLIKCLGQGQTGIEFSGFRFMFATLHGIISDHDLPQRFGLLSTPVTLLLGLSKDGRQTSLLGT